jgi:hypothetical protein
MTLISGMHFPTNREEPVWLFTVPGVKTFRPAVVGVVGLRGIAVALHAV